jgi:NAD(P) transhydrogenase subunit beta
VAFLGGVDVTDPVYVVMVILFVIALWRMSHPLTARSGIVWAGAGVLIAILITFLVPGIGNLNLTLIVLGIVVGGLAGWYSAARVQMTAMPQMVATFNGMGGGAAAAIAAVELLPGGWSLAEGSLSIAGAIIGAVSFTGSVIAFLKLQGWMPQKAIVYPVQQPTNLIVLGAAVVLGIATVWLSTTAYLLPFFVLALGFGFLMTLPIGGADMPVVISLFNALTGVAVAMDGIAIVNFAMVVAGTLVGAAGSLLTLLMARAMNRSIGNVIFSAFGAKEEAAGAIAGSMKAIEASDVAVMLAYAGKVIIAPGYGMAVSQAQQKVKELTDLLDQKGVEVKFAIHPVAGRMPGHMNVLLAEAGVPYEKLFDRDEIDEEFPSTDVVLVIGANDVVNPAARRQGSPLFGMPILDVDRAKNIVVLKRGQGRGFAGIENELFYKDNTRLLYGDAQESLNRLIQELKKL